MILAHIILLVPAFTVLLAVALQEMALPLPAWTVLRPDLALVSLYYWRLYRPDRCGPVLAFAAGLAVDTLSGAPLGVNAFCYVVLVLITSRNGSRLRAAHYTWQLLGLLALVLLQELLQWLWMMLLQGHEARWSLLMGRPLATLLVAPALTAILIKIHRGWLSEE